MSDLVRKLVVIAAIDGLILQPAHQRNQRSLQVDYKTYKVSVTNRPANEDDVSIDCHGIVGSRPQIYGGSNLANLLPS